MRVGGFGRKKKTLLRQKRWPSSLRRTQRTAADPASPWTPCADRKPPWRATFTSASACGHGDGQGPLVATGPTPTGTRLSPCCAAEWGGGAERFPGPRLENLVEDVHLVPGIMRLQLRLVLGDEPRRRVGVQVHLRRRTNEDGRTDIRARRCLLVWEERRRRRAGVGKRCGGRWRVGNEPLRRP